MPQAHDHAHKKKHGRVWRFLFVLHLYGFLCVVALILILGGASFLAWKVPVARRFVHTQTVRYYLRDVAPKLPFTIEDLDVDAKWKEFLKGWIRNFSLELHWNGWDLKLSGPIQISFDHGEGEKHLNATYLPTLEASAIDPAKAPFKKIPLLPLTVAFRAEANFSHLDSLTLHTTLNDWRWDEMHLRLQDFSLGASWSDKTAELSVTGTNVEFDNAKLGRRLELSELSLSTIAPLTLSPFRVGPKAELNMTAKQGATSWDGTRLNLPLAELPIHAQFELSNDENLVDLDVGRVKTPALRIQVNMKKKTLSLQWKTKSLELKEFISGVRGAMPSLLGENSPIDEIKKLTGNLKTQGSATIDLPWTAESLQTARIDGSLNASGISFEWPEKYLAVSGLELSLPVSSENGIHASFDIQKILFRRLQGSLGKTELNLTPKDSSHRSFSLHVGGPAGSTSFPLRFAGLPLRVGSLDGTLSGELKKPDWDLGTSFGLSATEVSSIAHQMCLSTDHIPPAQLVADFPKIALTPGAIDPTGNIRINLFEGFLKLSEIGIYDLSTPVPEVDFDLDLDGVRLDKLGDWAGFGEMDGILQASAHDVVFQAWLPTQYDFLFQASPFKHTKVVFSPEAMKNLARLVAADSIDHLPGIAEWAAFGLPSHLLGGYDIWFVGISLFSHDGHILMEVLDPPDLPISVRNDHKQNHYILYANRFTIPLKTSHYPLVVDATTVSNYVYGQAVPRLLKLRQAKKTQEKTRNEKEPMDCAPPTL